MHKKQPSNFPAFVLLVILIVIIGSVIAKNIDNYLLSATDAVSSPANVAKHTILDERAEQEQLKTDAIRAAMPARVFRMRALEYLVLLALGVFLLSLAILIPLGGWRLLHVYRASSGGLYPVLERGNKLINLNYIDDATYQIGTPQSDVDRERIGREVRSIQMMNAATRNHSMSAERVGQAVLQGAAQQWQDRIPIPREIPLEADSPLYSLENSDDYQ